MWIEPSEAEGRMMRGSVPGDLVSLAGMVMLVTGSTGGARALQEVMCAAFATCDRVASQLVPHPVLTYVAACDRCAERSGLARS